MAAAHVHVPMTQWNPNKLHTDRERWICVYPAYINSKKSRQEGRKIPKKDAVENPSYQEIRDVLTASNLPVLVENKLYSRERSKEIQFRGRIRVQLKKEDGTPLNPTFPTRDSVYFHLGQMIPQMKSRLTNPSGEPSQPSSSAQGGPKKGKNKRR